MNQFHVIAFDVAAGDGTAGLAGRVAGMLAAALPHAAALGSVVEPGYVVPAELEAIRQLAHGVAKGKASAAQLKQAMSCRPGDYSFPLTGVDEAGALAERFVAQARSRDGRLQIRVFRSDSAVQFQLAIHTQEEALRGRLVWSAARDAVFGQRIRETVQKWHETGLIRADCARESNSG